MPPTNPAPAPQPCALKDTISKIDAKTDNLTTTLTTISPKIEDLTTLLHRLTSALGDVIREKDARFERMERRVVERDQLLYDRIGEIRGEVKKVNAAVLNAVLRVRDMQGVLKDVEGMVEGLGRPAVYVVDDGVGGGREGDEGAGVERKEVGGQEGLEVNRRRGMGKLALVPVVDDAVRGAAMAKALGGRGLETVAGLESCGLRLEGVKKPVEKMSEQERLREAGDIIDSSTALMADLKLRDEQDGKKKSAEEQAAGGPIDGSLLIQRSMKSLKMTRNLETHPSIST